jgi:hypothetical protein
VAFGRIAAKDAIRSLWLERHEQRLFPADIELDEIGDGRCVARYRGGVLAEDLPCAAFASVPGTSAATASFEREVRITLRRGDGGPTVGISLGERKRT